MHKNAKLDLLLSMTKGDTVFSHRIFTLLDIMNEFDALYFYYLKTHTTKWIDKLQAESAARTLTKNERQELLEFSKQISDYQCKKLGFGVAWRAIYLRELLEELMGKLKKANTSTVLHEFQELEVAISHGLGENKFVLIDFEKAKCFDQEHLFGPEVSKSFPSAKDEIQSAGNCLAVDLNTAAVFHLMRAAELGMRALAVRLKVKLTQKGRPKPIEHGGWDEIINHIENKIEERREKYDKSVKKNRTEFEFLKFCRMMADELYKFKELDRNNTMHSIRSYNESEAKGVFDRVQDFMQKLSKEVSEK